jgi:hypothetical protein
MLEALRVQPVFPLQRLMFHPSRIREKSEQSALASKTESTGPLQCCGLSTYLRAGLHLPNPTTPKAMPTHKLALLSYESHGPLYPTRTTVTTTLSGMAGAMSRMDSLTNLLREYKFNTIAAFAFRYQLVAFRYLRCLFCNGRFASRARTTTELVAEEGALKALEHQPKFLHRDEGGL